MDSDDQGIEVDNRSQSESELIRYKKEKRKQRHDKLIQSLEKKQKLKKQGGAEFEGRKKETVFSSQKHDKGREYTVSLALPGSILDNAQSPELRTYLAGQIARALSVFNVDEVIVFDDVRKFVHGKPTNSTIGEFNGMGKKYGSNGLLQLARILQFLECPQYLRKHFFPLHKDLQYAGVLNPTDMPHHLRANEWSEFREGVVLDRPPSKQGSMVNIGLSQECCINKKLTPGVRVTVKLHPDEADCSRILQTEVVSPTEPREKRGLYWGYSVRLADSLSAVFSQCPYKGGYDFTIGTSERGSNVDQCQIPSKFRHLLITFGGVKGLEVAVEADEKLDVDDPADLFDIYINTCPNQGSRTIRTEEAILISLAAVRPKIEAAQQQ